MVTQHVIPLSRVQLPFLQSRTGLRWKARPSCATPKASSMVRRLTARVLERCVPQNWPYVARVTAAGSHLTGWAANAAQFVTTNSTTLPGAVWTGACLELGRVLVMAFEQAC